MLKANRIPAFALIVTGTLVVLYGLLQTQSGGSIAPLGIGLAGVALGLVLLKLSKPE